MLMLMALKRKAFLSAALIVFFHAAAETALSGSRGSEKMMVEADTCLARVELLPLPEQLFLATDVTDPVFGYLVGLLDRNIHGIIAGDHFEKAVEQSGRPSRIPHKLIREVRRAPGVRPTSGWIRASFTERLKVPVPYSILGYHPGSLISSQDVTFVEWQIPRAFIPNPFCEDRTTLEVENLTLWGIVAGEIILDIDGWLDALMGGKLDDTYIVGLAFFRFDGNRYAMALGLNEDGRGRSGALDVRTDKIRFPSTCELKAIGRELRRRLIRSLDRRGIPVCIPPAMGS